MENQVQTLEPNEEEVTQLIKKIRSLSKEGLFKVFGGTIREQQKTIEKLNWKKQPLRRVERHWYPPI